MSETNKEEFHTQVASVEHAEFARQICDLIEESAKNPDAGLAMREPGHIARKIEQGQAVISFHSDGSLAGFCYFDVWQDGEFTSHSGLVVAPEFRGQGLASIIKKKVFELSQEKYPDARLFGLTTSPAVMKLNASLGYIPVAFSELTDDEAFWKGCQSCQNFDILTRTGRKHCLCTGMRYTSA